MPRPRGPNYEANKVKRLAAQAMREAASDAIPSGVCLFRAMPSQMEFLQAKEREVLFSGGFGSGKSSALLIDLVASVAGRPGACSILARRHNVSLNRSTLPILLSSTGTMPPILPEGSYDWIKSDGVIQVHGGGKIVTVGCDYPERLRSINASDVYIDEAAELTEEQYLELIRRVRLTTGTGHIRSATNPSYQGHTLWKRFNSGNPDCRIVYGNSLDNTHLSPAYLAYLAGLTGDQRERYVYGRWTARGEMVYPEWNATMVKPQALVGDGQLYIGIDFGQTAPTGILVARIGEDGVLRILDEFYRTTCTFREILSWCAQWRSQDPTVVYDPSARSVATEFEAAGWQDVSKADNDVGIGIQRVRDMLGSGQIEVDPKCSNLMREMDGYSWDQEHVGKPIKSDDHVCDVLRYLCGAVKQSMASSAGQQPAYIFG